MDWVDKSEEFLDNNRRITCKECWWYGFSVSMKDDWEENNRPTYKGVHYEKVGAIKKKSRNCPTHNNKIVWEDEQICIEMADLIRRG